MFTFNMKIMSLTSSHQLKLAVDVSCASFWTLVTLNVVSDIIKIRP